MWNDGVVPRWWSSDWMGAGRIAFAMLFVWATALGAQEPRYELRGRVVDGGGAAVVGARVVLDGSERSASTDGGGRFVLRGLRGGEYRVHVEALGFAPAARVVVLPRDGWVEVVLARSPLRLPGVQVTATPGGGDVRAVAQATTELSGAELERSLTVTLAQTLGREPGIAVRYNGPAAAVPMIRGLSGDRILVLQDGQRVADLAGSAVDHAVTADPLAARRIEVVRGPAALLYGNNALGGVVNVVSEDVPLDVPAGVRGVVAGQAESVYDGLGASALLTFPLGERWAFSARGGGRGTGDVRIGSDPVLGERLANTGLRALHGVVGLGYVGESVRMGGALRAYDFRYGIPTPPGGDNMAWEGDRVEGVLRVEADLASSRFPTLRVDASVQRYEHDERAIAHDGGNHFALETGTITVRVDQAPIGRLERGAWGVSGLWKAYTSRGESSLTPPATSRAIGLFGFQQLDLDEGGAALQLGGRVDRYTIESETAPGFGLGRERDFFAVSGSVGVVAPLREWLTASLTVARAFRAPTVEELFSNSVHAGTGAAEFGNPMLDAERSTGVDAVVRLHSGRASGQLAAYHNRIAGYVFPATVGDTIVGGDVLPVVQYHQADAVLQGLEGSIEVAVTDAIVLGFGGDVLLAERDDGTPLPFLPPARVHVEARWDDGTWLLGATARHAAARTEISEGDETPTDAWTLLDLEAGFRLNRGEIRHSITIAVENATNALYRDATSRIKDFAPNPGRNVRLGYRVAF